MPNPSVDRGADIIGATRAPGLVLRVSGNPFDDAGRSSVVAMRLGDRTARLAAALQRFRSSLR